MSSTRLMSFSNRRPDFWGTAVTGVMLLVPVAAVLGLRFVGPWPVVVLLLVCIAARLLVPRAMPVPVTMTVCLIAVALAVLAVSSVSPDLAARLYPVFMSATMLVAFAATLWKPPSMIERFARIAAQREAQLRDSLNRAGVDTLELSTDDDLADAILRFVDLRKRRSALRPGQRQPTPSTP